MSATSSADILDQRVTIEVEGEPLEGTLHLPTSSIGLVLFAHGSGSSRLSPRNRFVAKYLNQHNLGTLLFDLLTKQEEQVDALTGHLRFNVELLAGRLSQATDWALSQPAFQHLPIGYFGASTGAAAALIAAAKRPEIVALVSRGGRPDLAGAELRKVRAAALLLVGELDRPVIEMNQFALQQLKQCSEKELKIIPGATHLFEEPGTLEEVARLAGAWFETHLGQLQKELKS
jgi:dienelactone hydrolase